MSVAGPRVRLDDPITSHEAADATEASVAASQRAVAAIFARAGRPLTAVDVEAYADVWHVPYSPSRLRSALPELEELGVLVRDGFVRREGDARRRQLWRQVAA